MHSSKPVIPYLIIDHSSPIEIRTTTEKSSCGDCATDIGGFNADLNTILWAVLNAIALIIILGGNILTIIAVRTCRRLRSIISNLFILSLAISDLLVGLALPYHVSFYLGWHLGRYQCLCLLRFFFMIFACCVSLGTLISIAVDRYIAVVYPFHYRRFMTRRVAYFIIVFIWCLGAMIASIPMLWNHWETARSCEFDEILPPGYIMGILTPAFVSIWILMLLLYWRIMKEATKQSRHFTPCGYMDWKSIHIVVLIMGSFTICWLPYFIVVCTRTFYVYDEMTSIYKYSLLLATCNSGLNPIIYAWKNSNFRSAFVRILCCRNPNCYAQQTLETNRFHSTIKTIQTHLPISHHDHQPAPPPPTPTTPTVQNIIILQSVDKKSCCLQSPINNAAHKHVTTATENNTCVICKCVIKNSIQLQKEISLSIQNCKIPSK